MSTFLFSKVMLVDDNPIDLFLHKRLLSLGGIANDFIEFSNGAQALEYLQQLESAPDEVPPVLLLDIQMPLMNGFDFLVHFDQLPAVVKSKTRIFTLSSTNNQEDLWKLKRNPHVEGLLRKPLDEAMLRESLSGVSEQ